MVFGFRENRLYLAEGDLLDRFPTLKANLNLLRNVREVEDSGKPIREFLELMELDKEKGGGLYKALVWIGPRGAVTPLHNDDFHNFFAQIVGEKEVILFPKVCNDS